MPPKTTIADRTLADLQQAIRHTVDEATNPVLIDNAWQMLHGPARDALSLTHWRMLIEQEQQARKDVDGGASGREELNLGLRPGRADDLPLTYARGAARHRS